MKQKSPSLQSALLLLTGLLLWSVTGISQTTSMKVFEEWNTTASTQNTFQKTVVRSKALGGSTYYYTAGSTLNANGNYDMIVSKLTSSGTVLWSQTYNGAGNGDDYAADVQIDPVGNVYICGTYYKDPTDSNNAIIIKYNTVGTLKWTKTYNGAGSRHDILAAMQLSSAAIVAVGSAWTGTTNKYDILAMRLDTNGNQVWAVTWDYASLNDGAVNLWSSGTNVFVAGGAQSAATTFKYAVVKLKFSDGSTVTSTVTGGTAFGFDQITDIQLDQTGNIYITGGVLNVSTLYDYKTVKLDTTLNIVWSATYNGAGNLNDVASGLYIDSLGNVIVTGYTSTASQDKNYATVKYNSSGTQQWVATFNGAANGNDTATAIVTKGTDIYVTGASANADGFDYYTIKYDASGNLKWQMSWNSPSNCSDRAMAIAIDTNRAVIVTGQTQINPTTYVYTTVKYSEKTLLIPTDQDGLLPSFCFTENRGQLLGTDNKPCDKIKFYNKDAGTQQQIYVADTTLYYVWAHQPDSIQTNDSIIRVDMTLVGDNNARKVYAMNERTDYNNYFLGYLDKPYARIKNYDKLYSADVYQNIDMVYGSNGAGMRYCYIVKPGGDPKDIAEQYTGASSVTIDGSGALVIATLFGSVTHPQPRVWQIDGTGTTSTLAWQPTYGVTGSTATMSFGSYDPTKYLIIEIYNGPAIVAQQNPTDNLEWSMHFGSANSGGARFYAVQTDKIGCAYYIGWSTGNNFPIFNSVFGGPYGPNVYDAVMVGMDTLDKRIFATYYGGSQVDIGKDIGVDTLGYFYFTGTTSSTDIEFPFSSPAGSYVDNSYNGGQYDMMIGKISTTGTQHIWTTYYGGNLEDEPDAMYHNRVNGHLFVTGYTASSNFPLRNKTGSYYATSGIGTVIEFDTQLDTVWATQFGGSGTRPRDIDGDGQNIFIVGTDGSSGGAPVYNPGGGAWYDATTNDDAFLLRFNAADTLTWGTGFGGNGNDYGQGVCVVGNKDIYIVGATYSSAASFPLHYSAGQYIDSVNGSALYEGYIARFGITGVRKWCSFYGDNGSDLLFSLAADDNETVYAYGHTASTGISLQANGNAYYQTYNGTGSRFDGLIVAFDPMNARIWATCYGGTQDELGYCNSIATYKTDKLIICGASWSTGATFPWDYTYANSWIDTTKSSITEITPYAARFNISSVTVGMNESMVGPENLNIYPNPTSDVFTVRIPELQGNIVSISVFDASGKLISVRKRENIFGTLYETIDLTSEAEGVYFVTVAVDERRFFSGKIIKQK